MTVQLGWDTAALVAFLAVLIFWLGFVAEYLWHAVHSRHH